MTVKHSLTRLAVLTALSAMPLLAGDGTLDYGLKFGAGFAVNNHEELVQNGNFVLSAFIDWKWAADRTWFAEGTFRTFRSSQREIPLTGTGYSLTGTPGYTYMNSSVDIRKNNIEGAGINLGYRQKFSGSSFSWYAGINVNFLRGEQEVSGQYSIRRDPNNSSTSTNPELSREGLNYVEAKSSAKFGIFAGIRTDFTANFFIDTTISSLGHDSANYQPTAWTGTAATVANESKTKVVLEVSAGFKF